MNPLPYQVRYLNRVRNAADDGWTVTDMPMQGIGTDRTFEGTEEQARRYAAQLNRTIKRRKLAGKCFAVLARDLTQAEVNQIAAS